MRVYVAIIFGAVGIAIAAIPFFGRPYGVGLSAGVLADMQAHHPQAVAMPFGIRYNAEYKLRRIRDVDPEIVIMGNSRGATLTAGDLAPHTFYNHSFTAWTAEQMLDEFDRLTRVVHPKLVILTLDYFLFTDGWQKDYDTSRAMVHGVSWQYLKASSANFLKTLVRDHRFLANMHDSSFLGVQAIVRQEGFRNDGSFAFSQAHIAYGNHVSLTADFFLGAFPGGAAMSSRQKDFIARLAALARDRHVALAAIQFPIWKPAVEALDHDPIRRPYAGVWREFESEANKQWLASLGISLFDMSRNKLADDEAYFVDAIHLSSKGMTRLVKELRQDPEFASLSARGSAVSD